jgi:hypothetical protein
MGGILCEDQRIVVGRTGQKLHTTFRHAYTKTVSQCINHLLNPFIHRSIKINVQSVKAVTQSY